jgi:hypothetical protein
MKEVIFYKNYSFVDRLKVSDVYDYL